MMRMVLEAIQFPSPIPDVIEPAAEDVFAPKIPDYIAHVDKIVAGLDLKERAIAKIGLDESQISEIQKMIEQFEEE